MKKGFTLQDVIEMLNTIPSSLANKDTTAKPAQDIEVRVSNILRGLGVPANIKGYYYLRFAIILTYRNRQLIENITKELYPAVAKEFQTTKSRVERAIRHAIECAWDRGDFDYLQKIAGNTVSPVRGKPTNGELIALLADSLHMEDKQQK